MGCYYGLGGLYRDLRFRGSPIMENQMESKIEPGIICVIV